MFFIVFVRVWVFYSFCTTSNFFLKSIDSFRGSNFFRAASCARISATDIFRLSPPELLLVWYMCSSFLVLDVGDFSPLDCSIVVELFVDILFALLFILCAISVGRFSSSGSTTSNLVSFASALIRCTT